MSSKEKRGLGRGLSALMADVEVHHSQPSNDRPAVLRADRMIPIEQVTPNPDQPRRHFNEDALSELASSVKEKGILQPLIVREISNGAAKYQIVAGERRWRAAQRAQLHEVPVIVREFSDTEVLEIAIIENIQRADLNAVEEAAGYRQLMERFGHTQEKLAEALGKSRSYIANLLRLLQLPPEVQAHLIEGRMSAGHARALITADDPVGLARKVVDDDLSVRETEKLARKLMNGSEAPRRKTITKPEKDADTRALEADLSANLGLKVLVDHSDGGQSGRVSIEYKSLDQLDEICRILTPSLTGA
ncbi:ParB/RepB/Spo0J family partition protein [Qingshengfaniella alkalisoli]|uniref:ParB/RepB/Spo0J family partition protein n=1 Tax=Qingshengfaniella alkalisoli TaxID=2599296 RepID=A0A5B8IYL8_9RHOB|nr:ParB/RepB/Spo0J family partition protein [Qingshengfaniella alkalisoli]QDY69991.1 ParB/RepB/Spo0J family partition protein [Qingshengfaniella alkalisoli]